MAWYDYIPTVAAYNEGKKLLNPAQGSTAPIAAEVGTTNATATGLAGERSAVGANPYAIDTSQAGQTRAQQEQAIQALQSAANGTAPSAAELQLQDQAQKNNAAAFGAAAALKGRTPGASFTTAARQNASNQLQTNANAAATRAAEMAQARAALSGTLATQQQQDQQGAQAAAALKTNYATNLLSGQLTSQGQGVTAAGDLVGANTTNAQTQNAFNGGLLGTAGTVGVAALSDKNEKKDIKGIKQKLDATFEALNPATFEYKNPDEPGAAEGPRVGVMAQDLQKTPLGKSVVIDGKPLKLDIGNALGLALDGMSMLTDRIKKLEARA